MGNLKLGIVVAKIEYQLQGDDVNIILPEPIFCKELAGLALQYNIDLFIFSSAEWTEQGLYGYRLRQGKWRKEPVPLPDIVYDRCFFTNPRQRQACEDMLAAIKRKKHFQSFNSSLPGKLYVYEALHAVEELIPFLPHTEPLNTVATISRWLQLYPDGIVIKPAAGMHGKGVLHVEYNRNQNQYEIKGRNLHNESFEASFLSELNALKWLYRFKKELNYLIQPYLQLRAEDNRPFDIRVLMQKDGSGQWQLTGSMARVGQPNGLTSNIHGGGTACDPLQLLTQKMGSYKAERLLQNIHMISGQTVAEIEGHFGRFGELALDFGVTPNGSIWLLECNSKPGRQVFTNLAASLPTLAHERPLQYAQYLQQRLNTKQKVI